MLTFGIAAPECTGHARDFDGFDGTSGHEMWTATEIGKSALCVGRNGAVFQILVDMFALIFLPIGPELFKGICLRHILSHNGLVFLSQLAHFFFNLREIALADDIPLLRHYVIEETIFDGRPETELNAGIKFLQRFGQQMRRRMPEGVLTFFIFKFVECDVRILVDRPVQFYRLTINSARYNVAGESR